jgi:hypothetical protein
VQKRIGEIENGVGALGKLVTAALRTLAPAERAAKNEEGALLRPRPGVKVNGAAAALAAES